LLGKTLNQHLEIKLGSKSWPSLHLHQLI